MKNIMLAIYDTATEAYMRPFMALSEGQAVRMFEDESLNPETPISQHPEDYALFRIGTFNDSSGELLQEIPKCLRRAHEVPRPGRD